MIREAEREDAPAICAVYNEHVENSAISFEVQPVSSGAMRARMHQVEASGLPWLVCEDEGEVVGYAFAAPWNNRAGYRFTVESTVYLAGRVTGRGFGSELYEALLTRLRQLPVHSVIGGIALPNPASVALHEKFGYQKAAHYKRVGRKFDRWIDVAYWQLMLADEGALPESDW